MTAGYSVALVDSPGKRKPRTSGHTSTATCATSANARTNLRVLTNLGIQLLPVYDPSPRTSYITTYEAAFRR
jgi:hypothetical protein